MATKKKTARRSVKRTAPRRAKAAAKAKKAPARRPAAPRAKPGVLRVLSVSPSFTVNDLERSVAFYRDVLGFAVTQRWEQGGVLRGVELSTGGGATFMLGQDDWQKGRDRQKGVGFRVYCTTTQDVDALAASMKAKGALLDGEPTTQPWGRFFSFSDPDGFKVTVLNEKVKAKR